MTQQLLSILFLGGLLTMSGCHQSVIADRTPRSQSESAATEVFFDPSERYASHAVAVADHVHGNDVALLINVKNALIREPKLERYMLEVGVLDGAVTLYGEVGSHEHREMAEQIARNVHGVESVKSGIAVVNPI